MELTQCKAKVGKIGRMNVKHCTVDIGKEETAPSIQKPDHLVIVSEGEARCNIVVLFEPLQ